MEEKVKELFSNEEYLKGLFELGSYEAAAAKLKADGVEVSAEELKKALTLLKKKEAGELSDEELNSIAGGLFQILGIVAGAAVVWGGIAAADYGLGKALKNC